MRPSVNDLYCIPVLYRASHELSGDDSHSRCVSLSIALCRPRQPTVRCDVPRTRNKFGEKHSVSLDAPFGTLFKYSMKIDCSENSATFKRCSKSHFYIPASYEQRGRYVFILLSRSLSPANIACPQKLAALATCQQDSPLAVGQQPQWP